MALKILHILLVFEVMGLGCDEIMNDLVYEKMIVGMSFNLLHLHICMIMQLILILAFSFYNLKII